MARPDAPAVTTDDERDPRWRWIVLVLLSLLAHVVIVWVVPESPRGIAGGPRLDWLEARLEPTPLTPNAPRGDLGSSGEASPEEVAVGRPGAAGDARAARLESRGPPRSSRGSTTGDMGPREERAEVALEGAHEGASGDEGAGGRASDAFLDALLARGGGQGGGGGAGCDDPIVGTWRARRWDARGVGLDAEGHHAVFILRVEAREGDTLRGTITLRAWSGDEGETSPPRCRPGHYDHTVQMRASGTFHDGAFRFDALDHVRTEHCVDLGRWEYNLDHFRGRLDGETLRVVNNDGGREVNAPYRFRRVACR
ncbi:MAG: hypothetical protein KF901_24990 [Myxococcales bacterium]|nr:hypothetical protein [Myxococcales bacterium]